MKDARTVLRVGWSQYVHDLTPKQIMDQVNRSWDLRPPVPIPKFTFICGCGSVDWNFRYWLFFRRDFLFKEEDHRLPCRVDVGFKCIICSAAERVHGIPVEEDWWNERVPQEFRTIQYRIHWKEAVMLLKEWEAKVGELH